MVLGWESLDGRSGHEAGRQLLARLYRQETGRALPEISLTPQGKPHFSDNHLHFSISHTKTHVFCCLLDKNVGIDAEPIGRTIDLRLAERWLSTEELAHFRVSSDPGDTLLRLWVLKESYAKLTGRGWGNYLRETRFSPDAPQIQILGGCYVAVLTEKECPSCFSTPMPI